MGLVLMSTVELDRVGVVQRVLEHRLSQRKAAELLHLTDRQVRRLCARFGRDGAASLASKRRGLPSNHRIPALVQIEALRLIRKLYVDFGPKLAHEKLLELHDVRIGRETLRQWMLGAGIWLSRKARAPSPHQPRTRRECFGELVQIDGSPHRWFEDRGPVCTLLVFVDDATGRLMELRFVEVESAFDYFAATKSYLERHGKPVAFYSDKHSIFRVYAEGATGRFKGVTQFGRALSELNIDIICGNTPQAKGRVERMNQTLQDRLVKELRLQKISTKAAANAFAPAFIADYNGRFAREPVNPHDAHRPLLGRESLDTIFTWQEERTLSKNLVVHLKRVTYLVAPTPKTRLLGGKRVLVLEHEDGSVELTHGGLSLPFSVFAESVAARQGAVVENKRLDEMLAISKVFQLERETKVSSSRKVSLRDKERLRAKLPVLPVGDDIAQRHAAVLASWRKKAARKQLETKRANAAARIRAKERDDV